MTNLTDDELRALLETPDGWSAERALEDAVKELAAEVLALRAEQVRLRDAWQLFFAVLVWQDGAPLVNDYDMPQVVTAARAALSGEKP